MSDKSLKPNSSERDLKRRSTLDPLNFFRPGRMSEDLLRSHNTTPTPERPESPPVQDHIPRFSLSKWRHASESQLSIKAKKQAKQTDDGYNEDIPPVPAMPTNLSQMQQRPRTSGNTDNGQTPSVMVTAPTLEVHGKPGLERRKSRFHPFTRQKQSNGPIVIEPQSARPSMEVRRKTDKTDNRKSRFGTFRSKDPMEELRLLADRRMDMAAAEEAHAADQQKVGSSLTLPVGRKSESARSEGDQGGSYQAGRATPERARNDNGHSSFTWLTRKNKQRASLFPLPDSLHPTNIEGSRDTSDPETSRPSTSARNSDSPEPTSSRSSPQGDRQGVYSTQQVPHHLPLALAASSISFAAPGALLRQSSTRSHRSSQSSPVLAPPFNRRTRSSTMGSNISIEDHHPPTPPFATGSGRNSTSTNGGRSSFSNLFNLNRLRHGDPLSPRQGSPGHTPANSMSISRENVSLPDRMEGEAPMKYLSRVEAVIPKSQIPVVLSKKVDDYIPVVLRSFMRKFAFFGDPLDMALRKILTEVDLPKETQQIDRVVQSFADRYHECNPGIFSDSGKFAH